MSIFLESQEKSFWICKKTNKLFINANWLFFLQLLTSIFLHYYFLRSPKIEISSKVCLLEHIVPWSPHWEKFLPKSAISIEYPWFHEVETHFSPKIRCWNLLSGYHSRTSSLQRSIGLRNHWCCCLHQTLENPKIPKKVLYNDLYWCSKSFSLHNYGLVFIH